MSAPIREVKCAKRSGGPARGHRPRRLPSQNRNACADANDSHPQIIEELRHGPLAFPIKSHEKIDPAGARGDFRDKFTGRRWR